MSEEKVGVVVHYFNRIDVAAVELTDGELSVGDTIHIMGHTSDFTQEVTAIQIEHESVQNAPKGASVGIKVVEHARQHDEVFKVVGED